MPEQEGNEGRSPDVGAGGARGGYAIRLYPLDEGEEIRLIDLWRAVWAGRWLIVGSALLLAILAVAVTFIITPQYRALAVLSPVSSDRSGSLASLAGPLGGLASLAGISLGAEDNVAESIAILKSRALTERFIRERNLMPILFHEDWDAERSAWAVDDPEDIPTIARGVERFDKSVRSVNLDGETGLVNLTVDWTDPQLARDWVQGLIEEVNSDLRGRAVEQSKRNIEFLQKQLEETDEMEIRTAVYGVMEGEMKNAMLAAVRTEFAFEVIDPAVVPEKPSWPNRILFAALGLVMGGLLGILAALIRRPPNRSA